MKRYAQLAREFLKGAIFFALMFSFFMPICAAFDPKTDPTLPLLNPNEIKIYPGETKVLSGENIERVLSSDASIATIKMVSPKEAEITGIEVGEVFVYFWDKNGRNTFRVIVSRIVTTQEAGRAATESKSWLSDFRFALTGSTNQSYYHIYNPAQDTSTMTNTVTMALGGTTPLGQLSNFYRFQSATNYLYLTDWWAYLTGTDYRFKVGDLSAGYSELTVPGLSFQGLGWESTLNRLKYKIDWGARNKPYWGGPSGITPDSFVGFTTALPKFINSEWDFVAGQTRDSYGNLDNRVFGIVSRYEISDWKVLTELAKSQGGTAFKSEADLVGPNYHFTGIVRDIGANHQTLGGGVAYAGVTGLFLKGDYKPSERLTLFSYYDYYYNFVSPNPAKLNYPNTNFGTGLGYDFKPWPFVSLGYSRTDAQGYLNSGISEGIFAGLSQTLDWFWKFNGYLRYARTDYEVPTVPANSYISDLKSIGLGIGFTPSLYLVLERNYDSKTMKSTGNTEVNRSDRADLNWRGDLSDKFYVSLNGGYQNLKSTSATNNYSQYYGAGSLTYILSRSFQFTLGGRVAETKSDKVALLNRNEKNIYASVSYVFDAGLGKLPRGLSGVVFEDLNQNGVYDALEPALAGMTLLASDKVFTKTDAGGQYSFFLDFSKATLKIKDEDLIGFELSQTKPISVDIEAGQSKTVNIGLIPKTAIKGFVFEDANRNGRLDITEKRLAGVVLLADDVKSVQTNSDGYFVMGLTPGSHKISINSASLPENYVSEQATGLKINISEGEVKEISLPVLNIRSISGQFFVDKNFDRIFNKDKGEAGFSGAILTFDGQPYLSGKEGAFIIKEVSTGLHKMTVKLPEPYQVEEKFEIIVDKNSPEKILVNFAVSPRFNAIQAIFNASQIKINTLGKGKGILGTGAAPAVAPEDLISFQFTPAAPHKGQSVKISAVLSSDFVVEKMTAVFPRSQVGFKFLKIEGTRQIWLAEYAVPKKLAGKSLDFKVYTKAKNYKFPMKKCSLGIKK